MNGIELTTDCARRMLEILEEPPADDRAALERFARIVWCHLIEPGDGIAGRIVAASGAAAALAALLTAARPDSVTTQEWAAARKRWMPRVSARVVSDTLSVAQRRGIRLVTPDAPSWPVQFDDLDLHAPMCLWVRGDPARLERLPPSVAVVGARAATRYGEHVAMEIAAELAQSGVGVVSGGAYGIDGAAHRATLSSGGLTIALLAGGADRAYPAGNARLIEDIASRGLVLSEAPCGTAPTKWRFLQRNRLIAALADATVVVEAGRRSGSLNTAGHAAALSRPLGAVPGAVTSAASAGTHRLIREYGADCITCADDVREMLGLPTGAGHVDAGAHTGERTRVTDALSTRTSRDAGEVARRAGMARDEVESMLGLLLLEGDVARSIDGWRLTPRR